MYVLPHSVFLIIIKVPLITLLKQSDLFRLHYLPVRLDSYQLTWYTAGLKSDQANIGGTNPAIPNFCMCCLYLAAGTSFFIADEITFQRPFPRGRNVLDGSSDLQVMCSLSIWQCPYIFNFFHNQNSVLIYSNTSVPDEEEKTCPFRRKRTPSPQGLLSCSDINA
jgi:hypothetical protein